MDLKINFSTHQWPVRTKLLQSLYSSVRTSSRMCDVLQGGGGGDVRGQGLCVGPLPGERQGNVHRIL
jgi:hypothetical protein